MIHQLPRRAVNDNEPPFAWYCNRCSCEFFVLLCRDGVTAIECGQCSQDVTSYVQPTLRGLDLCQR